MLPAASSPSSSGTLPSLEEDFRPCSQMPASHPASATFCLQAWGTLQSRFVPGYPPL